MASRRRTGAENALADGNNLMCEETKTPQPCPTLPALIVARSASCARLAGAHLCCCLFLSRSPRSPTQSLKVYEEAVTPGRLGPAQRVASAVKAAPPQARAQPHFPTIVAKVAERVPKTDDLNPAIQLPLLIIVQRVHRCPPTPKTPVTPRGETQQIR